MTLAYSKELLPQPAAVRAEEGLLQLAAGYGIEPRPAPQPRIAVSFRCRPELQRRLALACDRAGISRQDFLEMALEHCLRAAGFDE